MEEVIDQDRLEKSVEVHQGVAHLAAVCRVATHLKPAERLYVNCVSEFGGEGW